MTDSALRTVNVLVIKTSSLGDVIHTLPALTDAVNALPGIQFDWVVEEAFADIPRWHPSVNRIIPVALRRWRKQPVSAWWGGEWKAFKKAISTEHYDVVIDAQGLLKSALLTRYVKGPVFGLNNECARESIAARFYDHKIDVPKGQHAVERTRQLFAKSLGYDLAQPVGRCGIDTEKLTLPSEQPPYLIFFHGTTWDTKHWPVFYWQELAKMASAAGYRVLLPWGTEEELKRAELIAAVTDSAEVMPKLNLTALSGWIAKAQGVVSVDTGLAHLSAALDIPGVSIYGATDPGLSGAYGQNQRHLYANYSCAPCLKRTCSYDGPRVKNPLAMGKGEYVEPPCFSSIMPGTVFEALEEQMSEAGRG